MLLALILGAALGLRLSGIQWGLPSKNRALTTYHPDEPKSYYSLERMNPSRLDFHPTDGLYWGSLHLYALGASLEGAKTLGWIKAPSRQFLIDNLHFADRLYMVGRLLSIVFGVATVFLIYRIGAQWSASLGLWASFFLAVAPVHFIHSFFVRPDILMVFFAFSCFYFSLRMLEEETSGLKYCVWAGLLSGLAAATKYNGGMFLVCPWIACHLRRTKASFYFYAAGASFFGFVVGCPYALIDFPTFLKYLSSNASMAKESLSSLLYGPGWISYLTLHLPLGLGKATTILAAGGLITLLVLTLRKKYLGPDIKRNLLLIFSGTVVYILTTMPKQQMTTYSLPIVPFFSIFAGVFILQISQRFVVRWVSLVLIAILLTYNVVYALAFANLYGQKNIREIASEWIESHILKGESIGIARSYFWTPGVLRQYRPPYRLIEAGGPQSLLDQAVLNLENVGKDARYLVLSEYETRDYLNPKLAAYYPKQREVIEKTLEGYREMVRFEKDAQFLGFKFQGNSFPPPDWLFPNPKIRIYEKMKMAHGNE